MPKIRIRYLSDKIEKLRYIDGKSDWIDLRAAETVELKAGESRYIPLGVAMVLPQGYEAHVLPRSSTFRNYGILMSNSMGVVDESYCGDEDEWKMPVYATRDCRIEANDRIASSAHGASAAIEFEECEHLGNPSRGGFGSTGRQ